MRSVDEAISWLEGQVGDPSQSWKRLCLSLAANAFGFGASGVANYGSPNPTTWINSGKINLTRRGTPPRGALVLWKQPGDVGHIAVSDGRGSVYTNLSNGRVGKVAVDEITNGWGMQYAGWAPPAFPAGGYKKAQGWDPEGYGSTSDYGVPNVRYNPDGQGPEWLARILYAHGLRGDVLKNAWAIAMRESGGVPSAHNPDRSTGDDSYGLFQINMLNDLGPQRLEMFKKIGVRQYSDLLDPEKNVKAFLILSKRGRDLGAWGIGPNAYDGVNPEVAVRTKEWLAQFDKYAKRANIDPNSRAAASSSADGAVDGIDPNDLAASAGFAVDVITSNRELNGIYQQAVAQDWTPARFQAAIKSSRWYREHSAYWRDAWVAERTGGKDWDVRMNNARMAVRQRALYLGAEPDESEIDKWARKYIFQGWDQEGRQVLLDKALSEAIGRDGSAAGLAGTNVEYLRNVAQRNGLRLSDDYFMSAAKKIAAGLSTRETEELDVRRQAASMFPVYREKIMAGSDLEDLASGYINLMRDELDLNQVDLTDGLLQGALGGSDDQGNPVAMGLWDFKKKVRQDDRWQYSKKAYEDVGSKAVNIARMMGFF